MKKIIGAKEATNANYKGGVKKSKMILCDRSKSIISTISCVPGCNDACKTCENRQEENVGAGGGLLTHEEDRELNTSSFGNSGVLAANEGLYNN